MFMISCCSSVLKLNVSCLVGLNLFFEVKFFFYCIMSRKVCMFVTAQSQLNGTVCTYRPNCWVLATDEADWKRWEQEWLVAAQKLAATINMLQSSNLDVCLRVATLNSLYHFSLPVLAKFRSFWQLFVSFIRRISFLIVAAYQTREWWRVSISSSLSRDQSWSQRSDSYQYYNFGTNLRCGSDLTSHTLCMRQHQCVVFTHYPAVHYVVMNAVLYRGHISTSVLGLGTEKRKKVIQTL